MLLHLITPLVYLIVNIVDAWTDRKRIVKHKRGAYIYAAICFIVAWPLLGFTNASLLDVVVFPFVTRIAIFAPVRNLFAKQKILYRGDPNKEDKPFFDELEAKIPLSAFWLSVIYLLIYIAYLIIYFI